MGCCLSREDSDRDHIPIDAINASPDLDIRGHSMGASQSTTRSKGRGWSRIRRNRSKADIEELPYVIDDAKYRVVIAIDFGTTFSGCSWALTGNVELIKDIEKWPDQVNNYPKIPTAIIYNLNGDVVAWGQTAENMENFGRVPQGCQYYSRFKLHLDEKLRHTNDLPMLPPGKSVVNVIADYINEMHKYILSKITHGFTRDQMRYSLTVPASWSPPAKKAMRDAAILAGLISENDPDERLLLISEPEAALVYCTKREPGIENCRNIMICDAGGGTVDMCTFAVAKKPNGEKTLHEISMGHGRSVGSTMIDDAFERYAREVKLGHAVCSRIHPRLIPSMRRYFIDNIKRNFKKETDEYRIPSPVHQDPVLLKLLPPSTIVDGIDLIFTFEELRQYVFEPVIREILGLIREQVLQLQHASRLSAPRNVCDKLLLVGGFGESEYLLSRVKEEFMHTGLIREVDTVIHPGLAVVKGAAYFGLTPAAVSQRVSRYSYGICVLRKFEEGVDPEAKRTPGGDGVDRCNDSYFPFVHKGESIQLSKSVTHTFKTHHKDKCPEVRVYSYDGTDTPRYTDDPGVIYVGIVNIGEMPPISKKVDANNPLDVKIHMYFGLMEITATVEIEKVEYSANFVYKNSAVIRN